MLTQNIDIKCCDLLKYFPFSFLTNSKGKISQEKITLLALGILIGLYGSVYCFKFIYIQFLDRSADKPLRMRVNNLSKNTTEDKFNRLLSFIEDNKNIDFQTIEVTKNYGTSNEPVTIKITKNENNIFILHQDSKIPKFCETVSIQVCKINNLFYLKILTSSTKLFYDKENRFNFQWSRSSKEDSSLKDGEKILKNHIDYVELLALAIKENLQMNQNA